MLCGECMISGYFGFFINTHRRNRGNFITTRTMISGAAYSLPSQQNDVMPKAHDVIIDDLD